MQSCTVLVLTHKTMQRHTHAHARAWAPRPPRLLAEALVATAPHERNRIRKKVPRIPTAILHPCAAAGHPPMRRLHLGSFFALAMSAAISSISLGRRHAPVC